MPGVQFIDSQDSGTAINSYSWLNILSWPGINELIKLCVVSYIILFHIPELIFLSFVSFLLSGM